MGDQAALTIDFAGERVAVDRLPFTVGRDGDLVIDENPFLHRRFLQLDAGADGVPILTNVGSQLVATVSDPDRKLDANLAPGAAMPIVYATTIVRFAAGSTRYEFEIERAAATPVPEIDDEPLDGTATVGRVSLTPDQMLLVLSLAESALRSGAAAAAQIPTTAIAARRLKWTTRKYNRKLDNVCDKLSRMGVRGLHGDAGAHAANRKGRLVEYALGSRLVTSDDLWMLDAIPDDEPAP